MGGGGGGGGGGSVERRGGEWGGGMGGVNGKKIKMFCRWKVEIVFAVEVDVVHSAFHCFKKPYSSLPIFLNKRADDCPSDSSTCVLRK